MDCHLLSLLFSFYLLVVLALSGCNNDHELTLKGVEFDKISGTILDYKSKFTEIVILKH